MFHASKPFEQLRIIKKQTFQTLVKFEYLENTNVLRFIKYMQYFIFRLVEERTSIEDKFKGLKEIENG